MSLRAALRYCFIAVTVACATGQDIARAQRQNVGASTSSRQAVDRPVDESARQTHTARQIEAPKPEPSLQRQPEPQRQAVPRRQPEPQRQHEPAPQRQHGGQRHNGSDQQKDSDHWSDPGPAWRDPGPAWRNLNERQSPPRPGTDAFRATPKTYAPRDRGRRDYGNKNVYVSAPYYYPFPAYDLAPYYPSQFAPEPPPAPARDDRPLGYLTLRVQPRTADVYVDGAFAGTVDDFGGRGARLLPAGPHRVEIVADGYETFTFDVRVPEDDTVTFTRDLEPRVDRSVDPIVVPHKTMYIVPRCFIGDRMPLPTDMPAGCRVEDVRVIP
ncbi:MAG TPA: PEGA domain-containing protein [Vicinamibacterales bacterium]|nr:PEGA domain-containing protein [Vicinamibacterales bacterium]